jgi:dihydroorotate dehydrogenase (fumarate)
MHSPDLSVEFCSLRLKNPLVVAPAGISETVDRIKRCEDAGAGAVVMKSYSEVEVMRESPTPAFRVLRHQLGAMRSFTLYSYEQASHLDIQRYGAELAAAVGACDIPVLGSILCVTEDGWSEALKVCEQAGAPAVELNTSCPHGPYALGSGGIVQAAAETLQLARSVTSLPLIPKITPQLPNPPSAARALQEAGAAAVVMFNRFTALDIDIETMRPVMHGGYAGHGGPWALQYVLRWLSATYPHLTVPIAASGGVSCGEDVVKMILAGATVTQTCTAVVMEGYPVIGRLLTFLEEFMAAKGFEKLGAFRGAVCPHVLGQDEVDRRRLRLARVDPSRCVACGRCHDVCIYDAVTPGDTYAVVPTACSGCGLCAGVCPAQCIEMVPA